MVNYVISKRSNSNYYSKVFTLMLLITKVNMCTLHVYRYSFINEFLLCIQNSTYGRTETGDLLLIFLIISLYSDSLWGTWASGDTHKVYYLQLYIIYIFLVSK